MAHAGVLGPPRRGCLHGSLVHLYASLSVDSRPQEGDEQTLLLPLPGDQRMITILHNAKRPSWSRTIAVTLVVLPLRLIFSVLWVRGGGQAPGRAAGCVGGHLA